MNMKAIIVLFISVFLPFGAVNATVVKTGTPAGIIRSTIAPDDEEKLDHFIGMARELLEKSKGKLQEVDAYLDSATLLCEKRKIDCPSSLHLLKAEYFFQSGDYSSAEEQGNLALEKSEGSKEYEVQARTLNFLGRYYQRTGFFKESIESFNAGIDLAQKHKLKGIIPMSYRGQANVYNAAEDLNNYRKNLRLMADAGYAEGDTMAVMDALLLLGTSLTDKQRDFRKADSILRRCVELALIKDNNFYAAFASANIGWNYYRENMFDSSIVSYERSLKYSKLGNQISISANSYGNLGTINRDLGNHVKAIKYYQQSIEQANKVSDWYTLSWVYNDMHQLYLAERDTINAFKSFVLFKQFNDSVIIRRSSQGLTEARVRYEADMHNKEVALLSLRLKNNRLLNAGILGFFILAVIIGLLLFRESKLKDRRRMSEMNRKISELTQANLRQQMNPHFIFNTLNSIQYYMYQHDKLATNTYLTKFSSLMRKVLENSNHTSIPLRDELDALHLYLELESLRFKDRFDYNIIVDEEIDTLLFKIPTMLIQPYVENSICHGLMPKADKGFVKIDLRLNSDHIICTIEDNGIGREAASERTKQKNGNHNSMGTRIVSSRLDLVNELYGTSLKTVYTDLKNDKGEPEGTRVQINIPIMT
jgi:tetratricopeptide (TPR) repeat protein